MVLYSSPSENNFDKNLRQSLHLQKQDQFFLKETSYPTFTTLFCNDTSVSGLQLLSSKSIVWSDKPSAKYCCWRPFMLLRLIFHFDTMGVGSDF